VGRRQNLLLKPNNIQLISQLISTIYLQSNCSAPVFLLAILMRPLARLSLLILALLTIGLESVIFPLPGWAEDLYIRRYLDVREPVPILLDASGQTRLFSADELGAGKRFFEQNCKNCHVGGSTLPDPTVSLSLEALQQAMPSRDTLLSLVAFFRQPMTYDGSEETYSCRQVSETWLPAGEVENLAAFILRSAEKAPGWGNTTF
jgi:photosystem II cytochrome c550